MNSRRNIMLGTAGHVDHGKSALVKLLTGCETDTLAEEKQRGLTIDLGFAPCRLADKRIVGIVDVPGHVDFIRNMVAGAHGIDVVLFIVAADDGIMPQTHEHLHILTLMGLRHGLVALTKVDLVDDARRRFVIQELRRLLAGTFLANAPICPVSNVSGEGIDGFFEALNQVVNTCGDRPCRGLFRVWVEDAFTIRGAGTVVTGIPTHGQVRPGSRLRLLPTGSASHVRSLQVYGEDAGEGRAGECVALNVPELDHEKVHRGMVLAESDLAPPVTMFEGKLRILEAVPGRIEDYLEVQLHVGTAAAAAHVAMLESTAMTGGQKQFVQLRLQEPLPVIPGERFVVRANLSVKGAGGLVTIGGGQVLGISNTRLRRKKPWMLHRLAHRQVAVGDPAAWCELMLKERDAPVGFRELQVKCLLPEDELTAALESGQAAGWARRAPGDTWLHVEVLQQTAARALGVVDAFHSANSRRAGISRDELLAGLGGDGRLLDLAIEALLEAQQLERNGTFLARPGWRAQLSDSDEQLCAQVAIKLQQARWAPPGVEELAVALGAPPQRTAAMIRLLSERAVVVRLDERVWMHRDAVDAGKQIALRLFSRAPRFSTMEFRDALGVSRKYAVPLLDYLDRIRFTVRSGNHRTPGVEAKKLLNANSAMENFNHG